MKRMMKLALCKLLGKTLAIIGILTFTIIGGIFNQELDKQ